jgi:enoyl-[acyl-carrier-protein] reductase (NADH)
MIENHSNRRAPLRRGIIHEEAARWALFLSSPRASGVTGRVLAPTVDPSGLAADAGYFIMGA